MSTTGAPSLHLGASIEMPHPAPRARTKFSPPASTTTRDPSRSNDLANAFVNEQPSSAGLAGILPIRGYPRAHPTRSGVLGGRVPQIRIPRPPTMTDLFPP